MSEEILINVTPRETRVAVVENGMLQEVQVERATRRGYVGNIYRGNGGGTLLTCSLRSKPDKLLKTKA